MRKNRIFLSLLFIVLVFVSGAQTPTFNWAKSFGGTGSDISNSIALDASGNVYVSGSFNGLIDIDPGPGVYTLSAAATDVFVAKFDPLGALVWAQQFSSTTYGACNGIAVDAAGNVYTTGHFSGTTDFDPGAGTFMLTSAGGYDIFVSKLNSAGGFVWTKKLGGSSFDLSYAIAVDAAGNVYTTGTTQGSGDYDPGPGVFTLSPPGSASAWISKLDAAGSFVWAGQIESANTAVGNSITTDLAGNFYIAGYYSGFADLDPGPATSIASSVGSTDIFITKLNSAGVFVWAGQMGGTDSDWANAVKVDASGNVFATGRFVDVVDFDPGFGTYNLTSPGAGADVFICKLNSAGAFVWAKQLGGIPDDVGNSITLDAAGNIYTTGRFAGTADFDPGPGTYSLTAAAYDDVFISKLDPGGSFVWAKKFGGPDLDVSQSIAVDASDNVYTTGYFWDTPDFDPGAGVYTLTAVGNNDVFVHKMCIVPPSPVDVTLPFEQIVCNSQSATLSAVSPSGTVSWFATAVSPVVLGTGTTFITPTLSLGTYTYFAEAEGCFANPVRTPIGITVTPMPVFSASTNVFLLCSGNTATLSASGVSSATWFPGGAVGVNVIVSPTVTTTFTVYGNNGSGCAGKIVFTQAVSNCSTGIQSIVNANFGIDVYPNPFNDKLTIVTAGAEETRISIFNALGSLIYSERVKSKAEINLSEQPSGIYFVKANQNNSVRTYKIVKE